MTILEIGMHLDSGKDSGLNEAEQIAYIRWCQKLTPLEKIELARKGEF